MTMEILKVAQSIIGEVRLSKEFYKVNIILEILNMGRNLI